MKHLSQLSPAECLLVLNGNSVPMKELLKYTFLDLVLKKVLQVVEVEKPISSRDGSRNYKYIKPGRNFKTYYPLDHEQVFLIPFEKDGQAAILIRHFIKTGYNNIKTEAQYKGVLYNYPNLKKYFKRNFFQRLFGGSQSTTARLETARQINVEIKELELKLPYLLVNDRMQAADIMEKIKGNVFLLKDTETSLHQQVERELAYELRHGN
jgi:hypothetical protein